VQVILHRLRDDVAAQTSRPAVRESFRCVNAVEVVRLHLRCAIELRDSVFP
jgi:hypothetical protein